MQKNHPNKGRSVTQCIDDLFGIIDLLTHAVDDLSTQVASLRDELDDLRQDREAA